MPTRCFHNHLPDHVTGTPVAVNAPQALQSLSSVLRGVLTAPSHKPSVYTGAAGVAYALWHTARHAPRLSPATSEGDLLGAAERYARAALQATARQVPERHYGWSLLAGHAGVYCTGALVFDSAAAAAERRGAAAAAEGLRAERQACVERYNELYRLAVNPAYCQEDEVLYGRSGYLLGCLLLNRQLAQQGGSSGGSGSTAGGVVPRQAMQAVVEAVIASGRSLAAQLRDPAAFPTPLFYMWPPGPDASPYLGAAHGLMGESSEPLLPLPPPRPCVCLLPVSAAAAAAGRSLAAGTPRCPSPLYFEWHEKPYLGAAHGMIGILFALLHVPELVGAIPGAQRDVEAALQYVMSLECDAEGRPGQGGHYPTQMGPWRDREPLVHWCHGATGAVFLFCKAHEALSGGGSGAAPSPYLAAAERAGQAVWERGLLRKGPGSCHGVSGSAYALLRLHRATGQDRWLHRAVQFASFMDSREFREGARTPDHPLSLFEGEAARLCLLADLVGGPASTAFPMFEVDF